MSLKGKRVLFFAAPLYEDLELWYPKLRLEEEGAATTVAGLGEATYQGKRGYPVTVAVQVMMLEVPATVDVGSHETAVLECSGFTVSKKIALSSGSLAAPE